MVGLTQNRGIIGHRFPIQHLVTVNTKYQDTCNNELTVGVLCFIALARFYQFWVGDVFVAFVTVRKGSACYKIYSKIRFNRFLKGPECLTG